MPELDNRKRPHSQDQAADCKHEFEDLGGITQFDKRAFREILVLSDDDSDEILSRIIYVRGCFRVFPMSPIDLLFSAAGRV